MKKWPTDHDDDKAAVDVGTLFWDGNVGEKRSPVRVVKRCSTCGKKILVSWNSKSHLVKNYKINCEKCSQ